MNYFSSKCSRKRCFYSISLYQISKSSQNTINSAQNSLEITFQKKFKMFLKTMFSPSSESTPTALKPNDLDTIA